MENFVSFDLKVVVISKYLLFSLPTIIKTIEEKYGKVVGVESEISPISINRKLKKLEANLLILTVDDKDSVCELIRYLKRKSPQVIIITIANKLKQIPLLIKSGMIKTLILIDEGINQLSLAIENAIMGRSYYSPKVSQGMAKALYKPSFTPRETEIIDLRNEDKSRSEIARMLNISYNTVSTHIRNIDNKKS